MGSGYYDWNFKSFEICLNVCQPAKFEAAMFNGLGGNAFKRNI